MLWNIEEIAEALNLPRQNSHLNFAIKKVTIDSRQVTPESLFIALVGENNDGHDYLSQAFSSGASCCIVSKIPDDFKDDSRLILVDDTFAALNDLAIFCRQNSAAKIIGITGSVGKSSTKEMLKLSFSAIGKTYATAGNLNNHFGLPLTLANMPRDVDFAILEMGMNHAGEIAALTNIARPHLAIITKIAAAHLGNFGSEEEIALAKAEIFSGVCSGGFALINGDDQYFSLLKSEAQKAGISSQNIIAFGKNGDVLLKNVERSESLQSKVVLDVALKGEVSYLLPTINRSVVGNSLIIAASLYILGQNLAKGLGVLQNLPNFSGRGEVIAVKNNFWVIDDCYNANLTSVVSALEFLHDFSLAKKSQGRKIAILGDMFELGKFAADEHKKIAKYLDEFNIDAVILIGELMQNLADEILLRNSSTRLIAIFADCKNALGNLSSLDPSFTSNSQDIILIKGSRAMQMQNLVDFFKNF